MRPSVACQQDVFALPEHLAIVMEYADCGNLAEFISSYVCTHVRHSLCCSAEVHDADGQD